MKRKPRNEMLYAITDGSTFYSNELMTWDEVTEAPGWAEDGYQVFEFLVSWDSNGKRKTTIGNDVTQEAISAAYRVSEAAA